MIEVPVTEESLRAAIRHITDFAAVHHGKGDYNEALFVLRDSLGITEEMVAELGHWCDDFVGLDVSAPLLLGVMMGLIAADHAREHS